MSDWDPDDYEQYTTSANEFMEELISEFPELEEYRGRLTPEQLSWLEQGYDIDQVIPELGNTMQERGVDVDRLRSTSKTKTESHIRNAKERSTNAKQVKGAAAEEQDRQKLEMLQRGLLEKHPDLVDADVLTLEEYKQLKEGYDVSYVKPNLAAKAEEKGIDKYQLDTEVRELLSSSW